MPAALHAVTTLLALYALLWARPRLDCLFYSAFDYAQAALIRSAMPAPLWICAVPHWLYGGFYSAWKASLLALYYGSALWLVGQFLLPNPAFCAAAGVYAFAVFAVITVCTLRRVRGRDSRLHLPYNTFAPLHEAQRRDLARRRNRLRITALPERFTRFPAGVTQDINSAGREETARRYEKL